VYKLLNEGPSQNPVISNLLKYQNLFRLRPRGYRWRWDERRGLWVVEPFKCTKMSTSSHTRRSVTEHDGAVRVGADSSTSVLISKVVIQYPGVVGSLFFTEAKQEWYPMRSGLMLNTSKDDTEHNWVIYVPKSMRLMNRCWIWEAIEGWVIVKGRSDDVICVMCLSRDLTLSTQIEESCSFCLAFEPDRNFRQHIWLRQQVGCSRSTTALWCWERRSRYRVVTRRRNGARVRQALFCAKS